MLGWVRDCSYGGGFRRWRGGGRLRFDICRLRCSIQGLRFRFDHRVRRLRQGSVRCRSMLRASGSLVFKWLGRSGRIVRERLARRRAGRKRLVGDRTVRGHLGSDRYGWLRQRRGSWLGFPCSYDALAGELARLGCRSDCRAAVVLGGEQRSVCARKMLLLGLRGRRSNVVILRSSLLLRRRLSRDSTSAAVEAHSRDVVVDDRLVIDVGDSDAAEKCERVA